MWKGEVPTRSRAVAERFYEILSKGFSPPATLGRDSVSLIEGSIREMRSWFNGKGVPIPSRDLIVIEDLGDEEVILYPFGDKLGEAIGYLLLYIASKKEGMDVGVMVTPFGVSIKAKAVGFRDLPKEVGSGDYVDEIVAEALRRSPKLSIKIKEIQHSFGYLGKVPEESMVYREAIRQILEDLESDGILRSFFQDISSGRIRIFRISRSRELSPISKKILSMPLIRPWLRDITYLIVKLLKGFAMTVTEIAEALELPEKVIENKLKEMRKNKQHRVVQFKDVDTDEWRWALAEDLEEISRSPEFGSCFIHKGLYDHVECSLRYEYGSAQVKFVIKTSDLEEGVKRILDNISIEEIYEAKISPVNVMSYRDTSIAYYNIPKEALLYIIKNAISYIEKTSTEY